LQRLLTGAKIEHSGNFAAALGIIQSNIGLTLLITIANLPQVFESSSGGQASGRDLTTFFLNLGEVLRQAKA
jgi:hypothetical protein